MLKWFRKYNKYILVAGVGMLMIAFLVPQSMLRLGGNPGDEVIGTIDGRQIKATDYQQARREIDVLGALSPALLHLAGVSDALQWLLMTHEARKMGLSFGKAQVSQTLQVLGIDTEKSLPLIAQRYGVVPDAIEAILGRWLMIQDYQELINGVAHGSLDERLLDLQLALILQNPDIANGRPRLSAPLVERFWSDYRSKVTIQVLPITADSLMDQVPPPDDAALLDLFDKYKENPVGQSDPYGFGYKIDDRVRIEYLAVPIDRVKKLIRIEETELTTYYQENREQFRVSPPQIEEDGAANNSADQSKSPAKSASDPRYRPYLKVRGEIVARLKQEAAVAEAERIIKRVRALLLDQARQLRSEEGYRKIEDDWQPIALDEVATQIQEQFGILPDVKRYDDRWLDATSLGDLDGIGSSATSGQPPVGFNQYVMSAKEFERKGDQAMASLRLQAKLPSHVMRDVVDNRYVFRLIEVDPAHPPHSLDEVRENVVRDAGRKAAYEMLVAQRDKWRQRMADQDIEALAKELGEDPIESEPFSRLEVPRIDGIESSRQFVDEVFELVDRAVAAGGIKDAPLADLTNVIAVERSFTIYLVRLVDYQPLRRSELDELAGSPFASAQLTNYAVGINPGNPFSVEAIQKRVGFEPDQGEQPEKDKAQQDQPDTSPTTQPADS